MALPRRAAIAATLGLAACSGSRDDEAPPPPSGPPSYGYLLPLRLAVGRIEVVDATDPAQTRVMPPAPLIPADVVRAIGQDRLQAAGGPGRARFRTQIATLTREASSGGGMFSTATERLSCIMRCRLEVLGEDGVQVGFVEAEVRRAAIRPSGNAAERGRSAEEIVRAAGDALNVELEYQMRRNIRSLMRAPGQAGEATTAPGTGAPATGEPNGARPGLEAPTAAPPAAGDTQQPAIVPAPLRPPIPLR